MKVKTGIPQIDTSRDDAAAALAALRARISPEGNVVSAAGRQRTLEVFGLPLTPSEVVARVCGDVRREGLAAVLDYSRRIDRAELTAQTLRVPPDELACAHAAAAPEFLATVRRVRDNILAFQQAILHRDVRVERPHGVVLTQRYVPLARIGVCVPGGAAAYPSTLLMTAVAAQAAGVEQIAVVAPPTRFGAYSPDVLAVCQELGVTEVYRLGGAQAVAALAYGVEGLPRVDKIVGPGNLFVALAKRFVFGDVAIDSIAGPSEVIVLADATARADWVAADLIAQAEHSPGASVLMTWDREVWRATYGELQKQLAVAERGDLAADSLREFGALVLARDEDEAVAIVDQFAPEHLELIVADPDQLLPRLRTAGAIFVGPYSTVALGDYVAGPSHVLPTSGTARFAGGLSANDFLRPGSILRYTREGLAAAADDVRRLAEKEGLTAHRDSVLRRLPAEGSPL